jgi:hypothetical protein
MLKPITFENELPVFARGDIDLYGLPDYYGWDQWICIDSEAELVANPCDFILFSKPVHRYSRYDRFRMVLLQLLGWRGKVDTEVMEICEMIDFKLDNVWLVLKRELKWNDKSRYYNRIPRILYLMGRVRMVKVDSITFNSILERFRRLEYLFGLQNERKYFPSLRYTCCRLLFEFGVDLGFKVDSLLTKQRKEALDDFWDRYFLK